MLQSFHRSGCEHRAVRPGRRHAGLWKGALGALFILCALPGVALAIQQAAPAAVDGSGRLHLVVLHTSDIHGQVLPRPATWVSQDEPPLIGGLPRLAAAIRAVRAEVAAEGDSSAVLLVDSGDWTQGTPEGLIEGGRPFLSVLAQLGYDAMCVGNHEFDKGLESFEEHVIALKLPAVVANMRARSGAQQGTGPRGTAPYRIVECLGMRIQIVGLVTPSTPEITDASVKVFDFLDPSLALSAAILEARERVDWVLPVTHMGLRSERALAARHPQLDLICGGHSHSFLRAGALAGSTLISAVGSKASGLGRIDLWFDARTKRVVEKSAKVIELFEEVQGAAAVATVEAACAKLVAQGAALMDEVVGNLMSDLPRSRERFATAPAGNFITDAMREHMQADVALHNRGGIRCDLTAGPVTRRDLFDLQPFGNTLVALELSGAQLETLLKLGVEGGAHSGLEFSGMQLTIGYDDDGDARLRGVRIGGKQLDRERAYRVATSSFLATGGDGYGVLAEAKVLAKDGLMLRELLEAVFKAQDSVDPPRENRYREGR